MEQKLEELNMNDGIFGVGTRQYQVVGIRYVSGVYEGENNIHLNKESLRNYARELNHHENLAYFVDPKGAAVITYLGITCITSLIKADKDMPCKVPVTFLRLLTPREACEIGSAETISLITEAAKKYADDIFDFDNDETKQGKPVLVR